MSTETYAQQLCYNVVFPYSIHRSFGALSLKKSALLLLSAALLLLTLSSCGGSSEPDPNQENPGSQLPNRVLLTNSFSGLLQVIDADQDVQTRFISQVGGAPAYLRLSPGGAYTVYVDTSSINAIGVIKNSNETQTRKIFLPDWTESAAVVNDGLTAFAAVPNQLVTENNVSFRGALNVVDVDETTVSPLTSVPFEGVRRVYLDNAGAKLIALSTSTNTVRIYDVAAKTLGSAITGFDRPIYAVFSSDNSKAYVLNCGAQCGGTTSSVTEVTIATGATRSVNVAGATVALLSGNQLWVAGNGMLEQVDISTMTASTSGLPVAISTGTHEVMALAGNKLFIGAVGCSSLGCLSIVDTSSKSVFVDNPGTGQESKGDVTGIAPINTRDIVYVTEGGELRIYDPATNEEIPGLNGNIIDIFGNASSIVALDQ
jgi:hypothetical protein